MKKLLILFCLIPALIFGQQNIKQVLTNGNNAGSKSLIGLSLVGLRGATSGTVTVQAPAIITTYTFTVPANGGTSGYVLQTNGSGVTSWVAAGLTVGTTAIASGTGTRLLYETSGNVLGEVAGMTYTTTNGLVLTSTGTTTATYIIRHYNSSGVEMFNQVSSGQFGAGDALSNIYFGTNSGLTTTSGATNTSFGHSSMAAILAGSNNVGIGYQALQNNPNGNQNTAMGSAALKSSTADHNTAIGANAGTANTSGEGNTYIGAASAGSITTQSNNTLIGYLAGNTVVSPDNTAIGSQALQNNNGANGSNVAIGAAALFTSGNGYENCVGGNASGYKNTTGYSNTYWGRVSGYGNETGHDNVAMGWAAGANNFTAGTGSYNTSIGSSAGQTNKGSGNLFLGYGMDVAGATNDKILIGSQAGDFLTGDFAADTYTVTGTLVATNILSGTYTATITDSANTSARTAYQWQYMRVGNVVTVSGQIDIDPTTTLTSTVVKATLPIVSNFAGNTNCSGAAIAPGIAGQSAAVLGTTAYAVSDFALIKWSCVDVTNQPFYVHFTYIVQ